MVSRRRFLAACGLSALAGCADVRTTDSSADDTTTERTTTATTTPTTTAGGETTTEETSREPTAEDGTTAPASVEGTWPMIGFDGANTGFNPDARGPGGGIGQLWRAPFDGDNAPHPPSIHDSVLYTQAETKVYAFDLPGGDERWSVDIDLHTYAHTPTAIDGTVYAAGFESASPTAPGKLFAFAAADGTVEWKVSTPSMDSSPKVVDGTLYFLSTTADGALRLHAHDPADGSEQWTFTASDHSRRQVFELWSPAVVGGTVYLSLAGGSWLYALDAADGSIRWEQSFDRVFTTAPAVADGTAFVADENGGVVAVDAASGKQVWSRTNDDMDGIFVTPTVGDGSVYVADNYHVLALDAADGERRWVNQSGENNNNSYLALTSDTVYAGGTNLAAYDIADGEVRWAFDTIGVFSLFTGPAIADGVAYTGACVKESADRRYDHYVYAVGTT
jgi:outer membrane protein assembly factor BamB